MTVQRGDWVRINDPTKEWHGDEGKVLAIAGTDDKRYAVVMLGHHSPLVEVENLTVTHRERGVSS